MDVKLITVTVELQIDVPVPLCLHRDVYARDAATRRLQELAPALFKPHRDIRLGKFHGFKLVGKRRT